MQFNRPKFNFSFSKNDMLLKLIYINLFVFIAVILLNLPFWLMAKGSMTMDFVEEWFAVPADLGKLITRPWTLISNMFLHIGFFHLLGNLIWLYFLGQLFMQFLGERKLLTVYLSGGLAGAALFIVFYNLFPVFADALPEATGLGASASIIAIIVAIGTYTPNTPIHLFGLVSIKLKYIVLFKVIMDLAFISNGNSGGHIAHLGGALLGYVFAKQWLKGKDITSWAGRSVDFVAAIFKPSPRRKMKVKYKSESTQNYDYNARKKDEQAEIDAILDKISKSGYDSLSKKEKAILFKASGK